MSPYPRAVIGSMRCGLRFRGLLTRMEIGQAVKFVQLFGSSSGCSFFGSCTAGLSQRPHAGADPLQRFVDPET
jgi:hypothetical protein